MHSGTVAVALATHNSARYLGELLDSLNNQTYKDFTLVISDDNSSDETLDIIRRYAEMRPDWIKLLDPKDTADAAGANKMHGAKANFSRLIGKIDADYILPCDHDDVWLPEKIARCVDAIRSAEQQYGAETPILVHTDVVLVDSNLNLLFESYQKSRRTRPDIVELNRLFLRSPVIGCAMIGNRALYRQSLPVPPKAILHDWWFGLVAAAFGKIIYLDVPTIKYRRHATNTTSSDIWGPRFVVERTVKFLKNRDQFFCIVDQAAAFLETYGPQLKPAVRASVAAFANIWSRPALLRPFALAGRGFKKDSPLKTLGFMVALVIADVGRRPAPPV